MFQELLGGASLIGSGERKPSLSNPFEPSPSPSPSPTLSPSPPPSTTSAAAAATNPATPAPGATDNLRCPRCDSSNTKFCYYNNYNLTQPRHFCKTCRRYWTKGGALRNVPIGGGCRKNKSIVSVTTAAVNGKAGGGGGRFIKTVSSSEGGKPGFSSGGGFEQEIPVSPGLWASSAQNSHLLALLRATQSPSPNPSPLSNFIGSMGATEALSSFWRNNQNQAQQNHQNHHHQQQQQQQQQQIGLVLGEVQNNGIHEIYQRLRSSTANYYPHDHSSPLLFGASSSSSTSVLESTPVSAAAAEMGYWNPTQATLTWSDLQPTSKSAAYP